MSWPAAPHCVRRNRWRHDHARKAAKTEDNASLPTDRCGRCCRCKGLKCHRVRDWRDSSDEEGFFGPPAKGSVFGTPSTSSGSQGAAQFGDHAKTEDHGHAYDHNHAHANTEDHDHAYDHDRAHADSVSEEGMLGHDRSKQAPQAVASVEAGRDTTTVRDPHLSRIQCK